jgi:hypothetical protein
MAVNFYIEEADRSSESGIADENVTAGTLISDNGSGVSFTSFADGDYTGLALYDPEYLLAYDDRDVAGDSYEVDDRVKYHPREGSAVVKVRTIEETTDGITTAPSISHKDVVGFVDETDADAPTSKGRLVEEGYTNDENDDAATTTYNRSNSNFIAIGEARRPAKQNGDSVTDFDTTVRVRLYSEVKN